MKTIERFQFLANVLIVACSRPNAEVGKLVKAVVTYATEGIKTDLGDLRLEAYFDLLIQDIDSLRTAAEAKSKKCSESAKCRTTRNASSPTIPARKANAANASTGKPKAIAETDMTSSIADTANAADNCDVSKDSNEVTHLAESNSTVVFCDFNASDVTSGFIYWLLKGKHKELNLQGTGSTFKAISRKVLEEIKVPDIELKKQTELAGSLEKVYSVIQLRKQQLEELDILIKARLNKIAARWPAKAVTQFFFS